MATTFLGSGGRVNHFRRLGGVTVDVRWLDAPQQRAWRAFLDMHARLSARLNRDLQRTSGLTLSDYDILVHLTDVPGRRIIRVTNLRYRPMLLWRNFQSGTV